MLTRNYAANPKFATPKYTTYPVSVPSTSPPVIAEASKRGITVEEFNRRVALVSEAHRFFMTTGLRQGDTAYPVGTEAYEMYGQVVITGVQSSYWQSSRDDEWDGVARIVTFRSSKTNNLVNCTPGYLTKNNPHASVC